MYLIDQTSLDQLIPICEDNGISLVLGGIFNSGILIEPNPDTYFDYCKLDKDWIKNVSESLVRIPKSHESANYWLDKAYKLKSACDKFYLPLKHAAIQFPYSNKIVSSCLLGMMFQSQVEENINLYKKKINKEFWKYLKANELISSITPI